MGLLRAIALAAAVGSVGGCALIAPSDQELMGGGSKPASDSGARDGGDAGDASDAAQSGDAPPCLGSGERCNTPQECCSGLTCVGRSCR